MEILSRLPLAVAILCLGTTVIPNRCQALKLPSLIGTGTADVIQTSNCYKLLGRFSFLQESDTYDNVIYSFNYRNQSNKNLWLAVYPDENLNALSEAEFYTPESSCWDRLKQARENALQVVNLYDKSHLSSCSDGGNVLDGSLRVGYGGYSYFALIHVNEGQCNKTKGVGCQGPLMNVSYSLELVNSPENAEVFHRQISADESPYAYFVMGLSAGSALNMFLSIVSAIKLHRMKKWHYIPKGLFFASICLCLCNAAWVIHYVFYSLSGRPATVEIVGVTISPLRVIAQFFWLMSDEALVVCMLCLAKGWTLVRKKLSPRSRSMYGILLTWYTFYGWAALFWATATTNIANSVSIWDTAPGLILMAVRLMVFGFFVWAQNTTVRQYQQKKGFFCKMSVSFGFWLVSMPLLVAFSASGALEPKARFATIQIFVMTMLCLALLILNLMYWPGIKLTKGFPFHSFHLYNKHKKEQLKKEKEQKARDMANLTEEERAQVLKEEEEDRLQKMDPLSRFGVLLKKYEKEVQACMDFSTELRVGLREIDDINAQADLKDSENRRRRSKRSSDRRGNTDKLTDDEEDAQAGRRDDDLEEGGSGRRQRRPRRGRDENRDGDKSPTGKGSPRRTRRPRGDQVPH